MTKTEKPCRKRYLDYGLLLAAAVLMWLGGKYDYKPQDAHHKIIVATTSEENKGGGFEKSVILVVQHFKRGAMGLVLNHKSPDGDYMIGGPVDKDKVFAVHSLDVSFPDTVPMDDISAGVLEGDKAVAELEHAAKKPAWYRIYHGYAGWDRRQLDREMTDGKWEIIEFDPKFMTTIPPDKMWGEAEHMPVLRRTH